MSLFLVILYLQNTYKIMLAIVVLPCAMVDWILLIGNFPQKKMLQCVNITKLQIEFGFYYCVFNYGMLIWKFLEACGNKCIVHVYSKTQFFFFKEWFLGWKHMYIFFGNVWTSHLEFYFFLKYIWLTLDFI